MMLPPIAAYAAHAIFWASFAVRWLGPGRPAPAPAAASSVPAVTHTARHPRLFPVLHGLGFGTMYFALGNAVLGGEWTALFPGQDLVGLGVILGGTVVVAWSMRVFRSWRLAAALAPGHELCTDGPFRWVRHPIYLGFDLLAAGTALWLPSLFSAVAILVVAVVGDLRARSEERLLLDAYGERYRAYARTTRRFVPGVY
jgi:protein-S-isoprenylcysteine O-methyltransferase Ste14